MKFKIKENGDYICGLKLPSGDYAIAGMISKVNNKSFHYYGNGVALNTSQLFAVANELARINNLMASGAK